MAGTAENVDPPLVVSVPVINTPTHTVQVSPTQTNEPIVPQPLVLIPITGPTATSTQQFEQPAACDSHPNWVVYVAKPGDTLELMIEQYKTLKGLPETGHAERVSRAAAQASAIHYGKQLTDLEMQEIIDQLFACENPNYTPSGKLIVKIIELEELDSLFKAQKDV